ncbi:unnamed protein product [Symbiodinium sp. CCMP2592]|nr:unnamed protein product [Symbiodinium sp. CCMP2592]
MGWACVFLTGDPLCFSILAGEVPDAFIATGDIPSAFVPECCALVVSLWIGTTAFQGYQVVHKSDCVAALAVAEEGRGTSEGAAACALRASRVLACALARTPPKFEHVAGHSGLIGNELADAAARLAARGDRLGFLPWSGHSKPAFDWWTPDFRQVQWAGIFCRTAMGCHALPPTADNAHDAVPPDDELTPSEAVGPFLPASPSAQPTEPATQNACLSVRVVSYNVLSLNGEAFADGAGQGIAYAAGRPAMLAQALNAHNIGVAFLQEARTQEGSVHTADYLRFCSGTEHGHLGVEIWIRSNLALVVRGSAKLACLCRDACSVLASDPRRLVVHFRQEDIRFHFVCLHAPHRGHPEDLLRAWWHDTIHLCGRLAKTAPIVLGGDLNACVGSHTDHAISDAWAEPQDFAGTFVHDMAANGQLWLPATWAEHQQGEGWTFFQKRNSAATRPDFVALPLAWRDAQVSTWVAPAINAGQACLDHLATVASVTATIVCGTKEVRQRPKRIDIAALRLPANKARLCRVCDRLPVIPWQTSADSHAAELVRCLHDALVEEFPMPKTAPRRSYLSQAAWTLHQQVAFLRHQCARLRGAVRRHSLAAFFNIWRGTASVLPSSFLWAKQAAYIGTVRSEQLRAASVALRRQCRDDRAAHLSDLADSVQANRVDGAQALQLLLKQKHKKPFAPAVLPQLKKIDGSLCQSSSEITDRWRQHFGDMEAGLVCQPADLAGVKDPGGWPLPPSLQDLPTPGELMQALAGSKAGKAPGPDHIPGEALSGAPSALIMHVLPLLLKLCLKGTEAIGMQSATLCTLYKQRGARDECGSYRAIMLLPTIAKAIHRSLRPKLYRHIDQTAPPTLLGGRRGASVVFGGHLVRGFCRWQLHSKTSFAVIFADVASAYYSSIRELTARRPTSVQDHGCPEFLHTEHDGLRHQLNLSSVLSQGGASTWLEGIAAELHRRTWFTIAGDRVPVQTRRGSRPGSTFADLMFGAGVSAILDLKESLRAQTPDAVTRPSIPWDGRRDLSPAGMPTTTVTLGDVVWADDVAECVVLQAADAVAAQVAVATSNFAEAFASFGYTLTFGATKTAALVRVSGAGAKRARSRLFGKDASLPILLENASTARLPVVASYKHLGVMQTPTASLLPEIRHRCGHAWQAFRQGRKAVYRNKKISLLRRGILLTSAVFTRLFYGAGSWPTLRAGEEQALNGAMLGIMRQTLCIPFDGDQHICRAETCALLGIADPRLRYLRQLVAAAPDALWALTRLDAALLGAYRDAFEWLFTFLRHTIPMPDPLLDWEPWRQVMTDRPGRFRGWIKRAKRLAILRLTCGAALYALAKAIRTAGAARTTDPTRDGDTCFTEACLPCRIAFGSRSAWACHASKLHGYRTRATLITAGVSGFWCRACGKVYANAGRLRRHVAFSVDCQDHWGSFLARGDPDSLAPHPSAPPLQLEGALDQVYPEVTPQDVHQGLLSALLELENPDETTTWDTVVEFIAPLAHLRTTLWTWAAHARAQPMAHELASNVVLLLDPELCCDDFRHRRSALKGLDFLPALDTPAEIVFPFILSGPVFTLRLDLPPLPEYRYPFQCSVPLAAAERHAKWFEAACDTVGAFVQQSQCAPVKLLASSAALACLEPTTSWLLLGGFERCSDGICSPLQ